MAIWASGGMGYRHVGLAGVRLANAKPGECDVQHKSPRRPQPVDKRCRATRRPRGVRLLRLVAEAMRRRKSQRGSAGRHRLTRGIAYLCW